MKRALLVLVVLAAAVAGYAAAPKQVSVADLPWVPEALKAPCGKTELEWQLAQAQLAFTAPKKLSPCFDLLRWRGEVRPTGLVVEAIIVRRPGTVVSEKDAKAWAAQMQLVDLMTGAAVRSSFRSPICENGQNLAMVFIMDERPFMVGGQSASRRQMLSPNATPNDVENAIAKCLKG